MTRTLSYLALTCGLVAQSYAQCSLTMPKNTRTTVRLDAPSNCCGGLSFYDSGGPTGDYDNGENDTITFVASSGNRVEIAFSAYHTEGNFDTLFVYDGGSVRAPLLAALVREASGPFSLRSSGDSLTFRFKSGPIGTRYGWEATLRCVSGAGCQQLMPTTGSQNVDLGSSNCCGGLRFFDSGGSAGNYGNNQNGTITFTAPAGQQVRITFGPSFAIRSRDTLFIYDGNSTSAPLLRRITNTTISPAAITSSNPDRSLTLRFFSDASQDSAGWIAQVSCVAEGACASHNMPPSYQTIDLSTCCNGLVRFYDSGGASANYGDNEDRTITFQTPSGSYIQADFASVNLGAGYDIVYVYDGPNTSARQIAAIAGTGTFPTLRSSGNTMTFRFISDNTQNYSGWNAEIRCSAIRGVPNCEFFMPMNRRQTVDLENVQCCAGADFYDSGGEAGRARDNEKDTLTFTAPIGEKVRVVFQFFNLSSGDSLYIYEGTDLSAPPVRRLSGSSTPASHTSSGNALTLIFSSNASGMSQGWDARVSCFRTTTSLSQSVHASAVLYPNPSQGSAFLRAESPIQQVRIWDISGKLLYELKDVGTETGLPSLSGGVYVVEVFTNGRREVLRWVVVE